MQFNSLLRWAVYLLVFTTLFACEDHRLPQQRKRLKTVSRTTGTLTSVYTLNYDASGKVVGSAFRDFQPNIPTIGEGTQLSRYIYDSQNRLIQADYNYNYGIGSPQFRDVYSYDAMGNATSKIQYLNFPNKTEFERYSTSTYVYENGRKTPVRLTTVLSSQSSQVSSSELFYTGLNLTKIVAGGVTLTYTYDDKPNPFYGLYQVFGQNADTFSANNATNEYQLVYDQNGLLVRRFRTLPSGFDYNETLEYETY